MYIEDLYDARKRIIQLEYDLTVLKLNINFYSKSFLLIAALITSLYLITRL